MKFGKRLKRQVEETLPEWRDKFLSYKDLKKLVRLISVAPPGNDGGAEQPSPTPGNAEAEFIYLLNAEIDKFNAFFVEQEEDFIICQKELQDRIRGVMATVGPAGCRPSEAEYRLEMGRIRRDTVNFHGEMVLLVNYSSINYTGLAKILKKYDKRTGSLLRLPFIEKVLEQPFFTTDLISKLVRELENTMDVVFPAATREGSGGGGEGGGGGERWPREAAAAAEQSIFRNAVAALVTMQELRRGSSTYGHFSLPPLNMPDSDLIQSFQLPSPIPIL